MFFYSGTYVTLVSPLGIPRSCKIGFSWSMLLFWWFLPMFRGDWLHSILHLFLAIYTRGISILIYPFFYNRIYIQGLLSRGWQPATPEDRNNLSRHRFSLGRSGGARGQRGESRQQKEEAEPARQQREAAVFDGYEATGDYGAYDQQDWEAERQQAVDVDWADEE